MQQIGRFRWRFGAVSLVGLLLVLSAPQFLACGGYAHQAYAGAGVEGPTDDIAYLAQYGTWMDVEPFGNVWLPSVNSDWRPFAYGHWVWTDAGWAWVSYEPYGWLVFHYGNWNFQPDIGWFWIEGSEWSAAPVEWLNYDGYCSWAPLPIAGAEWQEPWDEAGLRCWVVVRNRDLDRDNIGHYRIGRPPFPREKDKRDVFHQPLGVHEFEKIAGRNVVPVALNPGPVPVYMNPRQAARRHEAPPGEVQHEPRPLEQTAPENRPTEVRPAENQPREAPPAQAQPERNRPEEIQPVQLHRMVLPQNEEARVRKYSPQVERKVLVPRGNSNPPPRKEAGGKKRK